MIYVLYHSNCYDGFGAAYAAWKKFGGSAKYIPVSYGYPLPEMPDAEEIYIVDFSYDEQTLKSLSRGIKTFVLDHHKTAEENLRGLLYEQDCNQNNNLYIEFDMNRSGALITWEYFHRYHGPSPVDSDPVPAPLLIQHISDRDLWTFKMDRSREIHAALVSHKMDFQLWDSFDIEQLKIEGAALLRQYQQLVDNICKKPFMIKIAGHEVPAVNTSIAWSEVGEKLGDMYPDAPFVASFTEFEDLTMWSLRTSKNNREFDVSVIAKQFGGGGHKAAAGFKISREYKFD